MKATEVARAAKAVLAFAVLLLAGAASANITDTRTWTGAGDGKWGSAENWTGSSAASACNVFPAGRDWTVEISEGTTPYFFSLELPAGRGRVTLTGTGRLQPGAGAFVKIGAGRELRVEGPSVDLSNTDTLDAGSVDGTLRVVAGEVKTGGWYADQRPFAFGGDAKLFVEGGTFGRTDGPLCLTNNATLTVTGGRAVAWKWHLLNPDAPRTSITRVRLLGGEFCINNKQPSGTQVDEGAHFVNLGGTLVWGDGEDDDNDAFSDKLMSARYFDEFLPSEGGKLVIPSSTTHLNGALYFFADGGDYTAGGEIYATNSTDVAAGNVNFYSKRTTLRGGATIYANALNVSRNVNDVDCDYNLELFRLNLGAGGLRRTATTTLTAQRLNFLDGVVFGAWGGDVPAETSAGLTVNLEGPVAYDTADAFAPATPRTVNMARARLDGATELTATGGGTAALSAATGRDELRALRVGDGTTLSFSGAKAALKAMDLTLGADAVLKLDLSDGDYVDASASAAFGEGAKIVVTALPDPLPAGTAIPVYFAPAGTDPDLSKIEYAPGEWPAGWSLAKSGSAVYLADGAAAPSGAVRDGETNVVNTVDFPVVVAEPVGSSDESERILVQSLGEGSLTLTGGAAGAHPLVVGGDVRLGGVWTASRLKGAPADGAAPAARAARLTAMPGAALTVTDQTGDVNADGALALAVAAGAAATINGADLTFTSNNTHYVDGALTVNCTLVPTARQVFRGDGTLTFAGGVGNAPAGGVRVEGSLTLVPGNWLGSAPLSVKGDVTVAPTADWAFRGAALELAHHSALTLATGAHTLTLARPVVSDSGTLTVKGGGTLALAASGSVLGKVTLEDGAKLDVTDLLSMGAFVDVLAVREDDASIVFTENCRVRKRLDEATGFTVYSATIARNGMRLFVF